MKILITGGAGFIGSALIRYLITNTQHQIMNIDKLTYAANLKALQLVNNHKNYCFKKIDICDYQALEEAVLAYQPDAIIHLAAESHVDNSINKPDCFIQTNIVGTYNLLEVARHYWSSLPTQLQQSFRFMHISTDEVFGDLTDKTAYFTEDTPYAPSSPYSASKASSDHLVRAWHRTYGLPILMTNCSNNYGPYQHPEKLIPTTIFNALSGNPIPVYGSGTQIRDWIYVDDHVRGLYLVLTKGSVGNSYNIGSNHEMQNIVLVKQICSLLNTLIPLDHRKQSDYAKLITFVEDRKGHDTRYAINSSKIKNELGWEAAESFQSGLEKTVRWYIQNQADL